MSELGDNKIITVPEGSDLVSLAALVGALQTLEDAACHGVALQSNTSTTAYTTDFPAEEYHAGMRLMFMPLYTSTGAASIDVAGLGAKDLCNAAGVQLSAAGAISARKLYWLEYDATLDGGNGGFRVYNGSEIAAGDYLSVANEAAIATPTLSLALPYYAVRANWTGGISMANLLAHANTRLIGPHISPGGGIHFAGRKGAGTSAVIFEMLINNVSGDSKNKTLHAPYIDDNLHYQIDAGAITEIITGPDENMSGVITVPAGAHTLRLYLENDNAEFCMLIMADWLDADVIWRAGGTYW